MQDRGGAEIVMAVVLVDNDAITRHHAYEQACRQSLPARKCSDWSEAARAVSLGRQTLAALRATTGENLLTASGQHALAEAVTALANNTARLIRALHGSLRPNEVRFHRDAREKRIMLLFPMVRKAAAPNVKPARNAISPEVGVL